MKQEPIFYQDILDLGFEVETSSDEVFFKQHGYPYAVYTKQINPNLLIDWDQPTRFCEILLLDDEFTILDRCPIKNLAHLKALLKVYYPEQHVKGKFGGLTKEQIEGYAKEEDS